MPAALVLNLLVMSCYAQEWVETPSNRCAHFYPDSWNCTKPTSLVIVTIPHSWNSTKPTSLVIVLTYCGFPDYTQCNRASGWNICGYCWSWKCWGHGEEEQEGGSSTRQGWKDSNSDFSHSSTSKFNELPSLLELKIWYRKYKASEKR